MIITNFFGGLGNQMFQYAIGRSVAIKNRDELLMDISSYNFQELRQFDLSEFRIEAGIASDNQIQAIIGRTGFVFNFQKKMNFLLPYRSYLKENSFGAFDNSVFDYKENVYIDGYWQNKKYFEDIRGVLVGEFLLKKSLGEISTTYLVEINNSLSISIHVRRGDYIENKHTNNVHGVCETDYYLKAVKYFRKKFKNAKFFIFSDDIEWCKANLSFIKNKTFIENTNSAVEDLELMKHCQHNIIANSTFSWWGAWLGDFKEKNVIAPKYWFSDSRMQEKTSELVPESWIRV